MSQPDPSPTFIVLPALVKKGMTVLLFKTADAEDAKTEVIRATAETGEQHVIYTLTHYVDKIEEWPLSIVEALVQPVVPVIVPDPETP